MRFWDFLNQEIRLGSKRSPERENKADKTVTQKEQWDLGKIGVLLICISIVPVGIDIGMTIRITNTAKYGTTDSVLSEYEALLSKASDCTECGVCVERCPFDVDIIANMIQAVDIFGK